MAVTPVPPLWQVSIAVSAETADDFADVFVETAVSINVAVPDSDVPPRGNSAEPLRWHIHAHYKAPPPVAELQSRMALIAALHNVAEPALTVAPIAPTDWVRHVEENLPPVWQSGFCLHGAHHTIAPSQARYRLQIDAGRAFGTGHHETTRGVLAALVWLAKRRYFVRHCRRRPQTADLGTGTGILAFASILLWRVPTLAGDIDAVAVRTARALARLNHLQPWFQGLVSDGCRHPRLQRRSGFDLITANILARPLARMAGDVSRRLNPGGVVILSGLLQHQKRHLLSVYRSHGLRPLAQFQQGHWPTLVLQRPLPVT